MHDESGRRGEPDGRRQIAVGALLAGVAVIAGTFGAHVLRARLTPDLLSAFETGARYQMYHALAIMAVGLSAGRGARWLLSFAGSMFAMGTVMFSGTLYLLAITGERWWGAMTPVGGLLLIVGWLMFAAAFVAPRAR